MVELLILLVLALLLNSGGFGERWRGTVRLALPRAFAVGGIGFVLGFFGPLLLTPDANQGPLLGIFITGPVGFLLGLLWGTGREWRRRRSSRAAA
jgi:hypothetical protein